jgi:hypothetical protein
LLSRGGKGSRIYSTIKHALHITLSCKVQFTSFDCFVSAANRDVICMNNTFSPLVQILVIVSALHVCSDERQDLERARKDERNNL